MNTFSDLFRSLDFRAIEDALIRVFGVLLCLTVHETCHGFAALALGDPTAKRMHRLSLNPLHHIDWLGLASMLLLGFGWAKPVPVDMRYFKKPKLGMALTALAGPLSNLLLSLLLLLGARGVMPLAQRNGFFSVAFTFFVRTAVLSVGLGLFNLVPLPPLDGSKILLSVLPDGAYYRLLRYERYGMLLLFVLIFLNVGNSMLNSAINAVFSALVELIF